MEKHPLDPFFNPKVIAVIGATETPGRVGHGLLQNLSTFGGEIIPINPKRETVFGKKAFADVTMVPDLIDLALIATPAHTIPKIIEQCVSKKIPSAVILSAGFGESGADGLALERQIKGKAQHIRIIGPNCLGLMNPSIHLNATFAADMALEGNTAFISQSGALGTAVLDWSLKEGVGFSSFVSIGSMLDLNFGDFIDYFGRDPKTKRILLYVESIQSAKQFISAAREVAKSKPIVLIKAGRTEESALAAKSHTGAIVGGDEVFNAALRRAGVMRVHRINEFFSVIEAISMQPIPQGPNLTIITNAGGPAVLATDALIETGGKLSKLDIQTIQKLDRFLPASWSKSNPVDMLGDASPERYHQTVETLANDSNSDGMLVILTPQNMTDPTKTAQMISRFTNLSIPMFACWMGEKRTSAGAEILRTSGIPVFRFPDLACRTFANLWNYRKQLIELDVTQSFVSDHSKNDIADHIIHTALKEKRYLLDESEAKRVIEAYGIPTVPTTIASSVEEAIVAAKNIGFPVVLKLYSQTITHKSDVGGVKLQITNLDEVVRAFREIKTAVSTEDFLGVTVQPMIDRSSGFELIVGSFADRIFGPAILFGLGGELVEVFKDRSISLPPLNLQRAKQMMMRTKIYEALKGIRGKKGIDIDRFAEVLVRFSHMIQMQRWIRECDLNPIYVNQEQIIALDARIILFEKEEEIVEQSIL